MKYVNLDYHPADSRIKIIDSEVCQTLNSRMGTGGNNVPLILVINDQGGQASIGTKNRSLRHSEHKTTDIPR